MTVAEHLLRLLHESGRPFEVLDHAGATTAREAAAARGTELGVGGKTILMKLDRIGHVLLVVGSDRRIDGRALRRVFGVQRYRFGSAEELRELTSLTPGEVPAFGRPLFGLPLYAGADLLERSELVYAAASRTRSIRMATADWRAVAHPQVVETFTAPGG